MGPLQRAHVEVLKTYGVYMLRLTFENGVSIAIGCGAGALYTPTPNEDCQS